MKPSSWTSGGRRPYRHTMLLSHSTVQNMAKQPAVYYVTIPDFGPFYCLGNKSGVEEKVSALYLRDDGKNS